MAQRIVSAKKMALIDRLTPTFLNAPTQGASSDLSQVNFLTGVNNNAAPLTILTALPTEVFTVFDTAAHYDLSNASSVIITANIQVRFQTGALGNCLVTLEGQNYINGGLASSVDRTFYFEGQRAFSSEERFIQVAYDIPVDSSYTDYSFKLVVRNESNPALDPTASFATQSGFLRIEVQRP